ncbi:Pimeloyl-ACP methyl ester carboxylesterase [Algoriphagus ornithinivorans]|uniref:Pimeloyl-ACP methyl ester carboxylesterase n=1 Tax=Algoriphagus ornithinivorans TaxID=226506 RepID=A0A1I5E3X8_9BACT|nr:alpha/beta hydrolase [Algoriphagus ornithinivorans]SFO06239.1 Pimeloyl-ACP methyl ester carboxylesterase [Algoriphagus ornithinivorans]
MSSVYFFEKGQGQPVVLIHGFCEIGAMWADFAEELSKNYRVICPDLPGFGNSPLEKSHLSLEELAVMLEEWMEENEIFEPIVIGHSLGGYVTLALLELMQQKLKAVGLFHSTAFADDADKKQMRNRTITFLKKNGVDKFVTSFVPQLFPEDRRKELSTAIETAVEQAKESTLEGLIAFTEAMRDRKDRTQVLEHFHGPKLLIAGTEDGSVKLEASRKQSYLFTDYFELENTGHMGMFERKGETLALIKNFCQKASS